MPGVRSWRRRAVLAAASCALAAGCALRFDARTLGVPVTMAGAPAEAVPGDTFTVTSRAVYLFWGLAPVKQPSLEETLASQLGNAGAVGNLAIHTRMRWSDVLVTALTLGLLSSKSVTFSGVLAPAGTTRGP